MLRAVKLITTIWALTLASSCAAQQPTANTMVPSRLVSVHVSQEPALDGKLDDPAWDIAVPLQVIAQPTLAPGKNDSVPVTIRCVHTDSHVYFAMTWEDTTHSVSHKTWTWDTKQKAYKQGEDREDVFALAFEHTGQFDTDMLAGVEAVWDVWHWKAFRTNPQGYAMDKTHHYRLDKPDGKVKSYKANSGSTIWIARPQDAGDSAEKKQSPPKDKKGDSIPQYVPGNPSGSAADVRAKGVWTDGRWTLEMGRRLDTDHIDDTAFNLKRSYKMGVASFDHTENVHNASGLIELYFTQMAAVNDFETDRIGKVPSGFTTALTTGGGEPGQWIMRKEADAPSGRNVVAQASAIRKNSRFPMLVLDKLVARDVDVSVRFKPISGRIDQAAGLVWRYEDKDNYFVVRANALEDNVVAYKVEKGRRSSIGVKGNPSSYGVQADVPSKQWNSLRVVAEGKLHQIYLNDQKLFEVENATFAQAGRIGLWTKADSVTYFDDLKIMLLPVSSR
jgi:hypothetical protein